MNICGVCESSIVINDLNVPEMMFGTGKCYRYLCCGSCGAYRLGQVVTSNDELYPTSYYSLGKTKSKSVLSRLRAYSNLASVAYAMGMANTFQKLIAAEMRSLGAYSLKGLIKKDNKILDIGCGEGRLIKCLAKLGFTGLVGIDPYLDGDEHGSGYKILATSVFGLENSEFDIIMLHHSFEHIENPMEFMKRLATLLRPDGMCIIRIPVADSDAMREYREHWVQLDAPRHQYLHTNASIQLLAAKSGMEIVEIINDSNESQFIGSEQYRAGIPMFHPDSYYTSPLKKIFKMSSGRLTKKQVREFLEKAKEVNVRGTGDQRAYLLRLKQKI